jgi:hypothetical protein
MRCHWTAVVCAALPMITCMAASASAQSDRPAGHDYEVAVGVMVPAGSGLREYRPGPTVRLGVATHWPERGGSAYRLDVEGYRLPDQTVSTSRQSLTGVGVGYSWLGVAAADTWRPYMLAGLGLQLLVPSGGDGYPGLLGGVRAGVGVRGTLRGVDGHVEMAGVGWVRSIGKARFHPLTVALRF